MESTGELVDFGPHAPAAMLSTILLANVCLLALPSIGSADTFGFEIEFVHQNPLGTVESTAFDHAELVWESLITGYQDTLRTNTLVIVTDVRAIDGVGGTLGTGFPSVGKFGSEENFLYAATGMMTLDSDDTSILSVAGLLDDLVLHEMGHVIGIGTLWSSASTGLPGFQELYEIGSGQYTGFNALANYRRDFDPEATHVPVEQSGDPGTEDVHWQKEALGNDLMTGTISSKPEITSVTLGSLADLGYRVSSAVVPEPAQIAFLLSLSLGTNVLRFRNQRN